MTGEGRGPLVVADLHKSFVLGERELAVLNGLSFTLGKDGRPRLCRVWSGGRAPEDSPPSAASSAPDPAATAGPAAPAPQP